MKQQTDNTVEVAVEESESYIKMMQTDGMYDGLNGISPEYPENVHYMQGYYSTKKQ
jgi:hypothetical protein